MTFEKYWPTACLPGEYDSMDACDQGRWRGVAQAAYQAGRDSMRAEAVKACEDKIVRDAEYGGRFGGYGNFQGDRTGPECAKAIGELK